MAVRRQLGSELRRLRGTRRGAEVVDALGWSESKLSRIETARIGITDEDLDRLLAFYGVPAAEALRLLELSQQGHSRSGWHPYRLAAADAYDRYVACEAEAAVMLEWEPQTVPGLLQTDEYARAIMEIGRNPQNADVVDQRVALRMARQAVLTRHPEPQLWAVLDEAALRRQVGGLDVMKRQVQRLYDASERPGITLQVLPFSVGAHLALTGAFTIFEFGTGSPPVIHSDGVTGGLFRDRTGEIEQYREVFDDVRGRALTVEETRDMLAAVGAEF